MTSRWRLIGLDDVAHLALDTLPTADAVALFTAPRALCGQFVVNVRCTEGGPAR